MSSLEFPQGVDVVQAGRNFPVVESMSLKPVPNRLFGRPRRSSHSLPQVADGSVLVFESNGRYALAPAGPKMLASEVVLRATTVSVVLIRAQEVPAIAELPSVNGSTAILRASYNCKVLDPVRVMQDGIFDVSLELRGYLLADAKLRMLGARVDLDANVEVSQRILARTLARHELEPPTVAGMDVRLVNVSLKIGRTEDRQHHSAPPRTDGVSGDYTYQDFPKTGRDRYDDDDDGPPRDGYATTYVPDGDEERWTKP